MQHQLGSHESCNKSTHTILDYSLGWNQHQSGDWERKRKCSPVNMDNWRCEIMHAYVLQLSRFHSQHLQIWLQFLYCLRGTTWTDWYYGYYGSEWFNGARCSLVAGCLEHVEILIISLVLTVHIKCTRQAEKLADTKGVMLGWTQVT